MAGEEIKNEGGSAQEHVLGGRKTLVLNRYSPLLHTCHRLRKESSLRKIHIVDLHLYKLLASRTLSKHGLSLSSQDRWKKTQIQEKNGFSRSIERKKHGKNESPLLKLRTHEQK